MLAQHQHGQQELPLEEAARCCGVSPEVLRRAMVVGTLRCAVALTQQGLAFVCTPADLAAWQAPRGSTILPPGETAPAGPAARAGEKTRPATLLHDIAADLVQADRTAQSLRAYLDQTAAAVGDLEESVTRQRTGLAGSPAEHRAIEDRLEQQQAAITRSMLAIGVIQRRLQRAAELLQAASAPPARPASMADTPIPERGDGRP